MTTNNARQKKTGFTLIEVFIAIAIMLLIISIPTYIFQNTNKKQSLEKAVSQVVSIINGAKSLAISSKEFSDYGVKINSDSIISFTGSVYNQSDSQNVSYALDSSVTITNINILGSTGTISFQKIKGSTLNTGSFKIQLKDNPTSYKTITIYPTGLLEVN